MAQIPEFVNKNIPNRDGAFEINAFDYLTDGSDARHGEI